MPTRRRIEVRRNRAPFGPWISGVNESTEPYLLRKGELSDAKNIDLDTSPGKVLKRLGSIIQKANIPLISDTPTRTFEFVRSDGTQELLITDDKKIIVTSDLVTFTELYPAAIPGKTDLNPSFQLTFTTAEDKVWISNGNDFVVSYDGTDIVVYDNESGTVITDITGDTDDTQTSLADAKLDRAGVGTYAGHLIVCTKAGDPLNLGITRVILTYDDALDKVTFSAFPATIVDTDEFKVGVILPRGRDSVFHFSTLFFASTPENQSEVRFNEDTDPNEPQIVIGLNNPNAWPALNQLTIAQNDGDRVWGFTPVYRDRFAAVKGTGIFRIDPNPTFKFITTAVSKQVGSRAPKSFQERDGLLIFLGQRADGFADLFETDFTIVRDFNRKHSRTFDSLKIPNQVSRSISISTTPQWNEGTKSDTLDTGGSKLSSKLFTAKSDFQGSELISMVNIDSESNPGSLAILGQPDWTERYEADQVPTAATPAWTVVSTQQISESISSGVLLIADTGSFPFYERKRPDVLNSTKDSYMIIRGLAEGDDRATLVFGLWNGSKAVWIEVLFRSLLTDSISVNGVVVETAEGANSFHTYSLLLKSDGTYKLWKDGSLLNSGTAGTTSLNKVFFAAGQRSSDPLVNDSAFALGTDIRVDFLRFHSDFKGDSLDNLSGKVSPTSLPDTLPTVGEAKYILDYKKATGVNPSLHRFGLYHTDIDLNGGSFTFETESAPSVGGPFTSVLALANGQEPGVDNATPVDQFLRLNNKLTTTGNENGPVIKSFVGGGLYLTKPLLTGPNNVGWALFIEELLLNGGTVTVRKIRRSTNNELTQPDAISEIGWDTALAGSDAEGFITISANDNIGTILGDGTPPTSIWVQLLLEFHPAGTTVFPKFSFISVNWLEGQVNILPVKAILHKKKYILLAAESDSSTNNIIVIFDSSRGFYNWKELNLNYIFFFKGALYGLRATGKDILRLVDGLTTDEGTPISAFIETRQAVLGDIGTRKKIRYLDCESDTGGSTNVYSLRTETSPTLIPIGSVTFSATVKHKRLNLKIGSQARRVTLRVENNNAEDMGLNGMILGWESQPARGGR